MPSLVIKADNEVIIHVIIEEYLKLSDFFVDYFQKHPKIRTVCDLTSKVCNLPESWFTLRIRRFLAMQALSKINGKNMIHLTCYDFELLKNDFLKILKSFCSRSDIVVTITALNC
ncbi:hypothetical protein QUF72_05475 [Desulfobacterales bacterium HSG2]|nr:hypothetical protein [Desulfobacterales bacterium HSG2]